MDFMISLFGSDQTGKQKLKLVNPSPSRFQHLVTQMKWRLREGQGEAIYEIGVEDDGRCTGLTQKEMDASMSTLRRMAVEEREVSDNNQNRFVAEVLVRRTSDQQQFIDLRVAVLGAADAGKSTLLGVLTQGEMDNGRGKSRLNLFRHLHEVQTGRTSSISMEILGFDAEGKTLQHQNHSVEEIYDKAAKLITFIDLAGHQKYMKTTLFGLTGYKPHFVALVVAANMGIVGTTKDHIAWAVALEVPFFIIVTKIDKIRNGLKLEKLLSGLEFFLKQPCYSRICARVRTEDDALTLAASFNSTKVVPIFAVSSVTGDNLDLLEPFLNLLPSYSKRDLELQLNEQPEFQIDEIFNVSDVGVVACGLLFKGIIREGDELYIGPDNDGRFRSVFIDSLQRNRTPCRYVQAGQSAAVSLGDFREFSLRKGMVLISNDSLSLPQATVDFEAEIYVIYHPHRYIAEKFQCTVYIGNVCQTAVMVRIKTDTSSVSVGQTACVRFKFVRVPEYINVSSRILFREGRTKGIGQITRILTDMNEED
uniref:Tr-type G domain-containing protein n=1 Tax=Romanomermis culicivorax TaxID=13658 RepID=A0A915L543_ROMCU